MCRNMPVTPCKTLKQPGQALPRHLLPCMCRGKSKTVSPPWGCTQLQTSNVTCFHLCSCSQQEPAQHAQRARRARRRAYLGQVLELPSPGGLPARIARSGARIRRGGATENAVGGSAHALRPRRRGRAPAGGVPGRAEGNAA